MGTPNSRFSKETAAMVKAILFDGKIPDMQDLSDMDLDVEYLRRAMQMVKPQLPYVPRYTILEEAIDLNRGGTRFMRLARQTDWGKELCLRLTKASPVGEDCELPLLSIVPRGSGSVVGLELFLTRKGEWIVYRESSFPNDENIFTKHETVDDLCDRLDDLDSKSARYEISDYLYAFRVADCIVQFVQRCVSEREARVAAQKAAMTEWHDFARGLTRS